MTNRPSKSLPGTAGDPDAGLGAELVELEFIPIIGFGEMDWLANRNGANTEDLLKPAAHHALAAILAAAGLRVEDALLEAEQIILGHISATPRRLDQSLVHIFEDTPKGLLAMDNARDALLAHGVNVRVQKTGIAKDPLKREALEALGAEVFDSLEQALLSKPR